ncbi:MAG: dTMP kinase [Candidatus Theseobacter exili]|nr:dTMP kinase [Candidatus Theseobacter exili]
MAAHGCFITFEGPEGSGKTSQAEQLAGYLEEKGHEVVLTYEPGDTLVSKEIRKILLDPSSPQIDSRTELLLFAADRAQHVSEIIKEALIQNKVVLCCRYVDSTIAYQGYGRNIDLNLIQELNEIATGGLMPDLTVLLDLDVSLGLERAIRIRKEESASGDSDRMESQRIQFHEQVRKGFLSIANDNPDRVKVLDSSVPFEDVQNSIRSIVDEFLNQND